MSVRRKLTWPSRPPSLDRWFEKGIDTPGIVLIKVKATRITFWDGEEEGEVAVRRIVLEEELAGIYLVAPLGSKTERRHELVEQDDRSAQPARIVDEEGDRVREVTFIEVGLRLSREDETTTEARGADGRWKPWSSAGYGFEPIVYGALSSVDDRVARWDGDPMELYTYCRGPVEWLACPGGGERPCERCEEVSLRVGAPLSLGGRSRNYGKRPITCHDRCPDYPRSPDIARLHQLEARVQVWRPRKAPIARVPSLYRSREDCLREHPAVR